MQFRIVDTGLESASQNIALDRFWLAGHAQGQRDNLLRFYRSTPSAWVGLHAWPEQELRLLYCHRKGIEVVRRLTGGGTLYVDPHQLGFSLILKWSERLARAGEARVLQLGCEAVAEALRGLGLRACYKAPNDVEVGGRKLASLFLTRHRGSVLLQGLLLLTADVGRTLATLRLPTEPARVDEIPIAASERLTALDRLYARPPAPARLRKMLAAAFAQAFNLHAQYSTKAVYAQLREPPAVSAWPVGPGDDARIPTLAAHWRERAATVANVAESAQPTAGGLLRARLRWDPLLNAPGWLEIGGTAQMHPADLLTRLGEALTGVPPAALADRLHRFCAEVAPRLIGFAEEDLLAVLSAAWNRAQEQREFGLTLEQSNRLTRVNTAAESAVRVMRETDTLLLPYCARPSQCRDRPLAECQSCYGCEVGAACRTAARHALEVEELRRYADLEALLAQLRERGSTGVVGMTCQTFFLKHSELFARAGLPMLLVDLQGTTCYELQQEAAGYSGDFPYQTRLDAPLLEKLVRVRPQAQRQSAVAAEV